MVNAFYVFMLELNYDVCSLKLLFVTRTYSVGKKYFLNL